MKISILVGMISLWFGMFIWAGIIEANSNPQANGVGINLLQQLFQPIMQNQSGNFLFGIGAFIVNAAGYFLAIIKLIFLWFPSIWTGDYIWFWYFFFVAEAIGIVVSIVIIARGGSSST